MEHFGVLQWGIGALEITTKSDKGILSILIAVENRSHNPSRYTGELKIDDLVKSPKNAAFQISYFMISIAYKVRN